MKKKNYLGSVFKEYFLELMKIDSGNITSEMISIIYILISVFQISSYLFALELKEIHDTNLMFLLKIFYFSNFSNFLFYFESSVLIYICFYFIMILVHFLVIFPLIPAILSKIFGVNIKNSIVYICIRKLYQKIFEMFIWILLVPILELSINISNCSHFAYILENRNSLTCNISGFIWFIGAYTCFLSCFFSLLILLIKTDNTFLDLKSLRINFSFTLLLAFGFRVIFIIVFPLIHDLGHILIYLILHFSTLFSIYDYLTNFPIRNPSINQKYIGFLCSQESFYICLTVLEFSSILKEYDLLFIILIFMLLFYKMGQKMHKALYLRIIRSDFQIPHYRNYFLEEIIRLFLDIENPESITFLAGIMKTHFKNCKINKCNLTKKKIQFFFASASELEREEILDNFVQNNYQIVINENSYHSSQSEMELFLLKYTSFLNFFNINPLKSFYEVQKISSIHLSNSFLFNLRKKIILKNSKYTILIKDKEKKLMESSSNKNEVQKNLDINDFLNIMREKNELEKIALMAFQSKIDFWEKYKDGLQSYEEVINEIRNVALKVRLFHKKLETNISNSPDRFHCLFSYKMLSLVNSIFMNNVKESIKMEEEVQAINNQGAHYEENNLNYQSFFNSNIMSLKVSFLSKKASILEDSKSNSFAKFFGYDQNELKNIISINQLMPDYIAQFHHFFFEWHLKKGNKKVRKNAHIESYGKKKNGSIFPLRIFVGYGFEYKNDFVLQGLLINLSKENSNEKSLIFNEKGQMQGIDEGLWEFFKSKYEDIKIEELNCLNVFYILPNLVDLIIRNESFNNQTDSLILRNQNDFLLLPSNLKTVLEYLRRNYKENNKNHQMSIDSMTKKTEKSDNQSNYGPEKKNFSKTFLKSQNKTKTILEIDSPNLDLEVKETLDELINWKQCNKYHVLFDVKVHYYSYGEKSKHKIKLYYLTFKKMILNKVKPKTLIKENDFDEAEVNESSEIESGFMHMPQENKLKLGQMNKIKDPLNESPLNSSEKEKHESNNTRELKLAAQDHKLLSHNFDNNNVLKLSLNPSPNIFTSENSKEKDNEEESKYDESFNLKQMKKEKKNDDNLFPAQKQIVSANGSSLSTFEKSDSIFNFIQKIQKLFPNNLTHLIISSFWELLFLLIFCVLVFIIAVNYVTDDYNPLEAAIKDFSKMQNNWCSVTMIATEIELLKKGYLQISNTGERKTIILGMIGKKLIEIKKLSNQQRNLEIKYNYQEVFKNSKIKFTEPQFYKTKERYFVDVVDQTMASLIDIMEAERFEDQSLQVLEFFPINFSYISENYERILAEITKEYQNSNQIVTQKYLILMLLFLFLLFLLKLFQLYSVDNFYQLIIKLLNIFLRVSQKNAVREFLFHKEILAKFFDVEKNDYLLTYFPEKILNKKDFEISDNFLDLNSKMKFSTREKKKKKSGSKKFSLHNLRALPLFKIKSIVILSLLLGGIYFSFVYLYWNIVNQKISDLIGINVYFYNLYNMPTHAMVLNLLKFRERIIFIPSLEESGEPSQLHQYRMDVFNKEFQYHLEKLEIYSQKFPEYLIDVQSHVNEQLLNDLIFSDSCDTMYFAGLIPRNEMDLCDGLLFGAFENGVISGMNQIIIFMKMQDLNLNNGSIENIYSFIKSPNNLNNLLAEYFYEIVLQTIFKYLTAYYNNLIIQEISNFKIMLVLSTIIVGIMIIFLAIYYKKKFGNLYTDMSFCLNLIPYEKLIDDEQTVFLIKKFNN